VRLGLGIAGRGGLLVQRFAEAGDELREPRRVVGLDTGARTALTTNSNGVLTLERTACADQKSGDVKMARSTARMSPWVFCQAATAVSMHPSGGSSATNRAHSFALT